MRDRFYKKLTYSYKFLRVMIITNFDGAKFENFLPNLFSPTLNFDNLRAAKSNKKDANHQKLDDYNGKFSESPF